MESTLSTVDLTHIEIMTLQSPPKPILSEMLCPVELGFYNGLPVPCHMGRLLLRAIVRDSSESFRDQYAARVAQSKIRIPPVNAKS